MDIVFCGLNFTPEITSTGRFSGELAFYLKKKEAEISVVTTPPYYPQWKIWSGYFGWRYQNETLHDIQVIRCPIWVPRQPSNFNRLPHLISFALSSFPALLLQALRRKPDVVLCIIPTLFSAPTVLLAARLVKAKAWLHIQDFELDAAFNLGMLPGLGWIRPLAQRYEQWIFTRFDHVSTISETMLKLCIQKGIYPEKISLLPNWVDTQAIFPQQEKSLFREELCLSENQKVVLYHGNMGRKQGLDLILDCAQYLKDEPNITFILCGDGAARRELECKAQGMDNVRFLGLQPEARLNELVNLADIHVLPQLPGAADLVMPSKLTGMLASGKVVIACAEPQTELGKVVGSCGRIVPPGDVHQLSTIILELVEDEAKRDELGRLGRLYAEKYMDRQQILERFALELQTMISGE